MAMQHEIPDEHISFEEYLAVIKKDPEHAYEYMDGEICMMTGGSPDHAIIGHNIGRLLGNLLQGRRCITYNSDVYVQVSEKHRVCPDVAVSCDPRDRGAQDAIHYPSLVVEVLSPGTEARDRGKKSLLYRSCPSIQEYLLVSSEEPLIELFRREKGGFWTLYTFDLAASIELTSLTVHFTVAEVYQDTSFVPSATE